MKFTRKCPIFRMLDEQDAREFYVDYLGFDVKFEHRFADHMPLYIGLVLGDFELHLSEHKGDGTPENVAYLEMDSGLKDFRNSLAEKDTKFNTPAIVDSGFGTNSLVVKDPFNNKLRFNEPQK